ncbi:bifunctional GNAT family N-acetyltransferase/carbon-nitrogen hydrolase family protein [Pseudobacteriovorax antillogorgiicola]|uniref:Predicted amidohydrolase n=1 Tax=Pseudobacteriovorax antillogorgiicola TaxID=1513793 RepID=A0A1Y6CKV0_9BACT|nr:bifunctional GNAT family N-acetyltransferase/carbon-nitrogen hydrolase family protein [Pseudobacteriovorax antillogorgiicola]TCS45401.1 putative amidohydrolase [Pseudobacteriovorax antillogorgiicola]SMF73893.1 Predicted amidohydrolase [Pseudobacteriovorax antillogorgiicola]
MLQVRQAKPQDIVAIRDLAKKCYPTEPPYTLAMLRGHINHFPEGQFVCEYEGKIVGYCATFIVSGNVALHPHTWIEVSGGGFASTHDPKGNYLYGMEVCVDTSYRHLRIGKRLYNARKKLCQYLRLEGIIFGGRIPGYGRREKSVESPEEYVELVKQRKFRDTVVNFQLRQGFEFRGILPGYHPDDRESRGYATLMVWRNPEIEPGTPRTLDDESTRSQRLHKRVRVATVQYGQRSLDSFETFKKYVEYFVDVVASYEADFVTFPELFTVQLLSIDNKADLTPAQAMETLTRYTEPFKEFMLELAIRYNINIIGGSHPTKTNDSNDSNEVYNVCYVFLRQGEIYEQYKIHPTPDERYWWNIRGGHEVSVIPTDCGPIGVLICYDSEFPELGRHLINQGAKLLFVPFCTDERQSYLRVRYCAQARAVENQCFVVLSGNVGNLPGVPNMDIQYGQSCILTPCDFSFARDGIAADTTPNVETVAMADLRFDDLTYARNSGTVQNLKNRRHDLYSIRWKK